jgi:hypothetical protein
VHLHDRRSVRKAQGTGPKIQRCVLVVLFGDTFFVTLGT